MNRYHVEKMAKDLAATRHELWVKCGTHNWPALPTTQPFGTVFLDLDTATGSEVDPVAQAWVSVALGAEGRYSVGFDALLICSACADDCPF